MSDIRDQQAWTLSELEKAFREYCDKINASGRSQNTKATYIIHADRFVRWMGKKVNV